MSYIENGSRVFLTGSFNPALKSNDYVITKRSEGRLKLYDSCTDIRAWSPNAQDNFRHFRQVMENRIPSGRILPYEVLFESLISLGQTELNALRRQLEKYKSLKLTPEQRKQLRDYDYASPVSTENSKCTLITETRLVENETGIPKRPGTPTQSYCSLSSNFQDIEIENGSSTDNSEHSQEAFLSTENFEDTQSNRRLGTHHMGCCGNYGKDESQEIIIKKDSEIIALSHELAAKNADLDELREICKSLEGTLNEKVRTLENLKRNLKNSKEQLYDVSEHMHEELEDWKKKFYDSKCLVEQLKCALAEKSHKCSSYFQEIQELRERTRESELLRKEKISLSLRLDELKNVLNERNDLLKVNRDQAIGLANQESEINRLLGIIKQDFQKHDEQEIKLKNQLHQLQIELEAKNSTLSQMETQQVILSTNMTPTGSWSQLHTSEIREMRMTLLENLEAVDEELLRRRNRNSREEVRREMRDRATDTHHENWDHERDFLECTIEKLTMQVSSLRVQNEEVAEEKMFTELTSSKEKMQRLVLELEPYIEERAALNREIEHLKRVLEDTQRHYDSREKEMEDKYESLMSHSREEREEFLKRIEHLKNLRKKEMHRKIKDEMDSEIDNALAIYAKRSIETMTKLSAGLRGAGDEMAKIRNDREIREIEIAKLREQVKLHISRGQGDEANSEHLKEILRLKTEKKRLLDELKIQGDSLRMTKDQLQSREFALKGSKQQKKDLSARFQKELQKMNKFVEEVEKRNEALAKENECLNKTVLMVNDLVVESDTMKTKLESLQEENSKLIEENSNMIKRCEEYENRLVEFANKELQMKEAIDRANFEVEQEKTSSRVKREHSQRENEKLIKEIESLKSKITRLLKELQDARENSKNLEMMENLWTEILKTSHERQKLDDKVTKLGFNLENQQRTNDRLEEQLKWQISENQILQDAINDMNENIKRISKYDEIPEGVAKKDLLTLPGKICEHIDKLRKQLNSSGPAIPPWQTEISEMRAKLLENVSTIVQLKDDIELWKNKFNQNEKNICALEEVNKDLRDKLENYRANESSLEAKLQSNAENEIKKKEIETMQLAENIEVKNLELKALGEKIQILLKEKNEIQALLNTERNLRQTQLSELHQKLTAENKNFRDMHNDRIRKLLMQKEESMQNGDNLFGSEAWLRSLTGNELAELHKRISVSIPCGMIDNFFKTPRALNDKQNQLLQQDEKLYHESFPYMYAERRNIHDTNPLEASFNDNLYDIKKNDFYLNCVIKRRES